MMRCASSAVPAKRLLVCGKVAAVANKRPITRG